jgi:hypothetical protein
VEIKMTKQKMISRKVQLFDFESESLVSIFDTVQPLIKQHGKDATVQSQTDDYINSDKEYGYGMEPKTDEQIEYQTALADRFALLINVQEQAQYAQLQAKFGK